MESGFVILGNQESIYFEEWGTQFKGKCPSLLLVHGNFSNCEWWHDTIQGLQHLKRHIVAVDQRGFGKSSYKQPCNSFKDWAEDLVDFCKLKGIQKCIANGWSFGGGVSMKLAEIAPELVTKLILTCSVADEGLKMDTNGKPCLTREDITNNHKTKHMTTILSTNDTAQMAPIYELIIFTFIKTYPQEKK